VGKETHFADVLDNQGEALVSRSVSNDEADLDALLGDATEHGTVRVAIDQPGSFGQLAIAIAVAVHRELPVAMCRDR
jgi:hypothetical protein